MPYCIGMLFSAGKLRLYLKYGTVYACIGIPENYHITIFPDIVVFGQKI